MTTYTEEITYPLFTHSALFHTEHEDGRTYEIEVTMTNDTYSVWNGDTVVCHYYSFLKGKRFEHTNH